MIDKALVGVGGCVLVITLLALNTLLFAWILMLLFGVVHHDISADVPAIGLWTAFIPAFLLSLLFGSFTKN